MQNGYSNRLNRITMIVIMMTMITDDELMMMMMMMKLIPRKGREK